MNGHDAVMLLRLEDFTISSFQKQLIK